MIRRILIDADGCPVVAQTVRLAAEFQIPCLILCDTAHELHYPSAETLVFSKGADSVDFALLRRLQPGDLVITQDYGLAAMCLARQVVVLNQDGMRYDAENIDALLAARHTAAKLRRASRHLKGPAPRTEAQNAAFTAALRALLI